ncbi:hypothetical protein DY000_02061186 [Brassica cretica]|uniref:Uncharacterized protein n=1 Tax=Brassica cretica TaxID=69181 RepID=A0ABQ7APY1_BRACR|nr:hypothetical protein DY000_02061186 [Brassica cretica]
MALTTSSFRCADTVVHLPDNHPTDYKSRLFRMGNQWTDVRWQAAVCISRAIPRHSFHTWLLVKNFGIISSSPVTIAVISTPYSTSMASDHVLALERAEHTPPCIYFSISGSSFQTNGHGTDKQDSIFQRHKPDQIVYDDAELDSISVNANVTTPETSTLRF